MKQKPKQFDTGLSDKWIRSVNTLWMFYTKEEKTSPEWSKVTAADLLGKLNVLAQFLVQSIRKIKHSSVHAQLWVYSHIYQGQWMRKM